MPFFTSKRERKLWIYLAIVLVAIYSTLAVAPMLIDWVKDQGLIGASFSGALLLILLAFFTSGLQFRPRGIEMGALVGIIAAYMLVFARMSIPEERSHLAEYTVVGILVFEILRERKANGKNIPYAWFWAILITMAAGVLDECIQALLPNRVFDWRDILFNTLAAIMSVSSISILTWIRNKTISKVKDYKASDKT